MSRPGLEHGVRVGRLLDVAVHNFGYCGNCLGEPAAAEAIAAVNPLAEDGHAVKLTDTEPHWTIQFPMTRVTFERGRRYALRVRLRADLVPGRKGQAMTVGIYDPETKKYGCSSSYRAERLSGGYAWYEVGDFDPAELSDRAYIYVGDGYLDKEGNRCVNALYLDKFQFREAKD